MPKAPITQIDAELEDELAKQKRSQAGDDPNQSADQEVPGSDDIPTDKRDGEAQRQPS